MKVVITKREVEEVRPKYRPKYKEESLELMRQQALLEKQRRDQCYKFARYENNNHIFRGKNILDNQPISATVRRYLGPPGSVVEGEKVPSNDHFSPLEELPLNLLSTDAIKYIYDENENIKCSVNPSNLIAPIKINDRLKHDQDYRSSAFNVNTNGAVDAAKAIRSMNPLFFDQNTESQNRRSFIPDLLYQNELDKVNSLHNSITKPHTFIAPPALKDPKSVMTSERVNNENYYPTGNNFFNKDPFKCYITTLNLMDEMSKDKPAHLKEYDRRFVSEGNTFTTGNVLFKKKADPSPTKQDACTSPVAPPRNESPQRPSIYVNNPSVAVQREPVMREPVVREPAMRQPVMTKDQSESPYRSSSPEYSPESIQQPKIGGFKIPAYQQYRDRGSEEQCRKQLPDRQLDDGTKKRVVFQDQKPSQSSLKGNKGNAKEKTSKQADSAQYYQNEELNSSQKNAMSGSSGKDRKSIQNYDHFHDESMSKLEAVLQRQRERLENMGGFSGKSSQISRKSENSEQKLEDAYKDLETEIYNIKRNLETSQNSDGNGYTPMKFGENSQYRESDHQEQYDLSPSDLEDDEHPTYEM